MTEKISMNTADYVESLRGKYPEKFVSLENAFSRIHRGNELFIGSGCAEPRFLVSSLCEYTEKNPKAFFDVEIIHLWNFGPAEYADEKFRRSFRLNSFIVCAAVEGAVASGRADYTPIFPSMMPRAFERGFIDLDVALIQVSPPDETGRFSLGTGVDIIMAAVKRAEVVIAQVNARVPRTEGETFITAEDIDYLFMHDEPLLEYRCAPADETADQIGRHAARIVRNGDTIQAGHGAIQTAVLSHLKNKKDLGIHTDILTDAMIELIKCGAVTNKKKSIDTGLTVASMCAGTCESFGFINENPLIKMMPIDYTNNPMIIASQKNMLSINEARVIDLTGQASAEGPEEMVPRGMGGQADFTRGTSMAPGGTTITVLRSTSPDEKISRIAPALDYGTGISSMRCDAEYVVTEYGAVFLHGRSLRERAMALISIAHPKFRPWLLDEAKKLGLVLQTQALVAGKSGIYPEHLETEMTAKNGEAVLLRPVKISDEDLLKDFFYSLSDQSMKRRFISPRLDMHHERLQNFVVIDYSSEMIIIAIQQNEDEVDTVIGLAEYRMHPGTGYAETAFAVRDDQQGKGIGTMLLKYITRAAVKAGLNGFTAEVLVENRSMMSLFEKMNFEIEKTLCEGTYELTMTFKRGD
jgi:acyl-CoA hydrolase/GNAT superfamily N-acetyltransferase